MHPKMQRFLAPLLIVSLLLAAFFLSLEFYAPAAAQQPAQDGQVDPAKTSTEAALKKLTPKLREAAKAGGDQTINIRIDSDSAINVSRYAVQAVSGDPQPLGEVITLARVKPSALLKIAALPGVVRLSTLEPEVLVQPDMDRERRPTPPLTERRERYSKLMRTDRAWDPASEPDALRTPTDWWDIRAGHQSQRAWTKGYRGEGVKVAVIDSGTDMAHPDMLGTWAVITDTASPYYGWPIAYDPFSMLQYIYDANFDTDFVASGQTWYVDTSTTPPVTRTEEDIANGTAHVKYAPFLHSDGRGRKEPGDQHNYKVNHTSKSGVYHIGSHPDRWISEVYGEHMAVLLVDEQQSGVYDTVYVDLDNDYDFTDEKPVTRNSPASYRDMDGDGFADLSGGVVYFIANGTARIPGSNVLYGNALAAPPARASLVAFMGTFDPDGGGDHGNLCGSNIVSQGRINGNAPQFIDMPPANGSRPAGINLGSAPGASLISVGDAYIGAASFRDSYLLTMLGYDGRGGTADDAQIGSNSYGFSATDNDGWDYDSRYVDRYVRRLNPTYLHMDSTGNGAPGAGTTTPASPSVGMTVGASTQYGSTDWDSITRTTQIQSGNVTSFSNRGPSARGTAGVDVVANGDRGTGAALVNVTFNGATAWETWGGTSRSTPVAAGNMALVYQAFRQRTGRWPRYDEARALLKAGAVSSGHDVMTQGAGVVNADYATDIAAGRQGVYAMPDEWNPGDYRGREYPAFANIIHPGASDTQNFSLSNPSASPVDVHLSAKVLRRFESREFSFTSKPVSQETPYAFLAPDYLFPVNNIPPSAELMIVTMRYPYQQHDGNDDYTEDQQWRLLIYDWTDVNGDSKLWEDRDGDGHVDKAFVTPSQFTQDGFPKLDWSQTEIQPWEYVRTMYTRPYGNIMQVNQAFPAQRMHGGLFIGLQHAARSSSVPTTTLQIRVEFFKSEDWPWVSFASHQVTIAPRSTVTATATISIPANTAAGIYQGSIQATYAGQAPYRVFLPHITAAVDETKAGARAQMGLVIPDRTLTIPVVASVAERFNFTGALTFGGSRAYDPNATYNNGAVSGWYDWSWRAESGDWRFYFFDATQASEPGAKYLTRNVWSDPGPPTDIDTLLLGPTSDRFSDPNNPGNGSSNWADPDFYGPYTLDDVGKSNNTYLGSGKWRFQTATGGAEEWVAGNAAEGLHLMMLHNVLLSGAKYATPYTATLGVAKVNPATVNLTGTVQAGNVISDCLPLTFSSTLDLPGLAAEGFGLSKPENLTDQAVQQDDPDDPATSSYKRPLTLNHASSLNITLDGGDDDDLDLFLLRDANGDGTFAYPSEVIASSTTSTADETISLRAPSDGAYQVWVHGWSVPGGSTTFDLLIDAVQGRDLTVRGLPGGPLPANTVANLQVCYQKTVQPGDVFKGEVLVGPSVAPSALSIPVRIAIPTAAAKQE